MRFFTLKSALNIFNNSARHGPFVTWPHLFKRVSSQMEQRGSELYIRRFIELNQLLLYKSKTFIISIPINLWNYSDITNSPMSTQTWAQVNNYENCLFESMCDNMIINYLC